jgi:hypothetical protein
MYIYRLRFIIIGEDNPINEDFCRRTFIGKADETEIMENPILKKEGNLKVIFLNNCMIFNKGEL